MCCQPHPLQQKEEDGKPKRAIIEARRTKIKRKVLGYSAAVQGIAALQCDWKREKNN